MKEMDFETEEKMELVSGNENGERILEKLQEMSETEKLMRFNKMETSADLLYGKFEECNENMKKLRQNLIEKVCIFEGVSLLNHYSSRNLFARHLSSLLFVIIQI